MIISSLVTFVKGFSCGLSLVHHTADRREWVGRGWEVTGTRTVLYSKPTKGFTLGDFIGNVGRVEAPKGDDTPPAESPSMRARLANWLAAPVPEATPSKPVVKAKAVPAKPREVQVVGGVTPELEAWLASKGCVPGDDAGGKSVVFTAPDARRMGEAVEADRTLFFFGEVPAGKGLLDATPSTPILVRWKDSGKLQPLYGGWKQVHSSPNVWRFEEQWQGSSLDELSGTVMPYGEMRIFPRPWGSEAHVDPWAKGVDTTVPVLGFASETLGQRLEKTWEGWADAVDELDRQWEAYGDKAPGVKVPVAGVPFGMLKLDFLSYNFPAMYGELRQKCRKYLRLHRDECGYKLGDALAESGTHLGTPEVRPFERTCSGHWTARDEFVSTGCPEGHMVRTQFDRELRELLRCEDPRGYRLHPLKAKALAKVAELFYGQPSDWLRRAANEVPEGHEEYADDRPIDGPVEYRGGAQVDRFADQSQESAYEHDVERLLDEMEESEEGFNVADDHEDLILEDNTVAWQDEYEDLTRGAVPFSGHLAANSPYQVWYGALRTIDRLGRVASRARTPGEDTEEGGTYAQQVRGEFDSTCQAVRESQRFLAAAEATEVKGGTLKSHLEEARKAARQAVTELETGVEEDACRIAFTVEGLVAEPSLVRVVASVLPSMLECVAAEDPDLHASLLLKTGLPAEGVEGEVDVQAVYEEACSKYSRRRSVLAEALEMEADKKATFVSAMHTGRRPGTPVEHPEETLEEAAGRLVYDTLCNELHKRALRKRRRAEAEKREALVRVAHDCRRRLEIIQQVKEARLARAASN